MFESVWLVSSQRLGPLNTFAQSKRWTDARNAETEDMYLENDDTYVEENRHGVECDSETGVVKSGKDSPSGKN